MIWNDTLFGENGLPIEYENTLKVADSQKNILQSLKKMWIEIVRKCQQLLYNTIGEKTYIPRKNNDVTALQIYEGIWNMYKHT